MEEEKMKWLAAQLRCPSGEGADKVAENMAKGNDEIISSTIDLLSPADGDVVLEIGPGSALHLPYLFSKVNTLRYYGVDISTEMIAMGEKNNHRLVNAGQATFTRTDGQTLAFRDAFFDKIFTVNTIYFWKEPAEYLGEIAGILKPQGQLVIGARSRKFMEGLPFTRYGFTLYSPEELIAFLSASGFKIISVIHTDDNSVPIADSVLQKDKVIVKAEKQ